MYACNVCGHTNPKWLGKCPECETWNSLEETIAPASSKKGRLASRSSSNVKAESIQQILENIPRSYTRISTHSKELNRVLGGGLTPRSSVLISGEPGIGKSTLLLQAASHIQKQGAVLYVCAEESTAQVALRAKRINIIAKEEQKENYKTQDNDILLTSEYHVERIESLVQKHKPSHVIIDSIQTIRSEGLGSLSGRITHINACTSACCEWTHAYNTTVLLIAHVTKEGSIAGPKSIEHMVDTVLMFDSAKNNVRFLYAYKNRYGATDEIGILKMSATGLADIGNAESLFLEEREGQLPPGICVAATYEGSRPFLVELQALTIPAPTQSRVFSERIDARQVFRIAAVLERHMLLPLSNSNIYVNVAGGIRVQETGFELALLIALYSAYKQKPIPIGLCAIGEVSLAGELMPVEQFSQRCRQALEYGFTTIIAPYNNARKYKRKKNEVIHGIKTIAEIKKILSQNMPITCTL